MWEGSGEPGGSPSRFSWSCVEPRSVGVCMLRARVHTYLRLNYLCLITMSLLPMSPNTSSDLQLWSQPIQSGIYHIRHGNIRNTLVVVRLALREPAPGSCGPLECARIKAPTSAKAVFPRGRGAGVGGESGTWLAWFEDRRLARGSVVILQRRIPAPFDRR